MVFQWGNVVFSHLLFADDTLIFYGAFLAHLRLLQSLFLCFEAASVADHLEFVGGSNQWNVRFARVVQDWEMDIFAFFF
jgi:hypothetical protein